MTVLTQNIAKKIDLRIDKENTNTSIPTYVKKIALTWLSTLILLSQMACSSTVHSARSTSSDNQYAYQKSFGTKSVFSPITRVTGKKDFQSDGQLMTALLNREITEDQKLMQSFTQTDNNAYYVGYSSIRGPRINTASDSEVSYAIKRSDNVIQLIAQDRHMVNIRGRY